MNYAEREHVYALNITCPARPGIIAAVTAVLARRDYDIKEMAQFDDEREGKFFMRCVFEAPDAGPDFAEVWANMFRAEAERLDIQWRLRATMERQRVLIMVSKGDHCLRDLLYRAETGEIHMDVAAIGSNHLDLAPIAERASVPFHHLPVSPDTKEAQEAAILDLVERERIDLVILARYMQVLSSDLAGKLFGRCINIHHSFLPSFKGARPYRQAHDRGVKLTGATAHYVTSDLDEGPIIEQDVRRVGHKFSVRELEALGRDTECLVLARAVKLHLENRVFIDGPKTVVLD
jgi:formyltetrahydrofolate deformylase